MEEEELEETLDGDYSGNSSSNSSGNIFGVHPKSGIKQNTIDLTKAGYATFRELLQANNAPFELSDKTIEDTKAFNDSLGGIMPQNDMYNAFAHADQKVNSELNDSNLGWGDSFWDKDEAINYSRFNNLSDERAENQWGIAKVGAGIAKGVGLAGTTFLEGSIGIVTGAIYMSNALVNGIENNDSIGKIVTDVLEQAWNDPFKQKLSDINEKLEEWMPNYKTRSEQNNIWAIKNIISANFLGDTLIKNAGFMVGAVASGYVGASVVGGLKGIKMISSVISKMSKAAPNLSKFVGTAVGAITAASAEAGSQTRDDMRQQLKVSIKKNDEIFEAEYAPLREKYKELALQEISTIDKNNPAYEEIVDEITAKYNNLYEEQKKGIDERKIAAEKRIKEEIQTSGNLGYLLQTALLAVTDGAVFGNVFNRGYQTSRRTYTTLRRNITQTERKAGVNTVENVAGTGATNAGVAAGEVASEATSAIPRATQIEMEKGLFSTFKLEHPTLYKAMMAVNAPLFEGGQEMGQGAISGAITNRVNVAMKNYYDSGQDPESALDVMTSLKACWEGFSDTLGSSKNLMEGFVGALLGGIGIPMGGVYINNKGEVKRGFHMESGILGWLRRANTNILTDKKYSDILNKYAQDPKTVEYLRHLVRCKSWEQEKNKFLLQDNKFEYLNAEHKQLVEMIAAYSDVGRMQDLEELINNSLESTDEDLVAIQNNTTQMVDGKPVGPFVEYNLNDAQQKEEFKKKLQERKEHLLNTIREYNNTRNTIEEESKGKFSDEQIATLTWMKLQGKNASQRGLQNQEKIKETLSNIKTTLQEGLSDLLVEDKKLEDEKTLLEEEEKKVQAEELAEQEAEKKKKRRRKTPTKKQQKINQKRAEARAKRQERLKEIEEQRAEIKEKREANESLMKTVEEVENISSVSEGFDVVEKHKDNIKNIVEAFNKKDQTISDQDRIDVLSILEDNSKLRDLSKGYQELYDKYMAAPSQMELDRMRQQHEREVQKKIAEAQNVIEQLEKANSIQEMEEILDKSNFTPEEKKMLIAQLALENPNVNEIDKKKKIAEAFLNILDNIEGVSDQEKADAKELFKAFYSSVSSAKELLDTSLLPADDSFFDQNGGDPDHKRFETAMILVEQTIEALNKNLSVGQASQDQGNQSNNQSNGQTSGQPQQGQQGQQPNGQATQGQQTPQGQGQNQTQQGGQQGGQQGNQLGNSQGGQQGSQQGDQHNNSSDPVNDHDFVVDSNKRQADSSIQNNENTKGDNSWRNNLSEIIIDRLREADPLLEELQQNHLQFASSISYFRGYYPDGTKIPGQQNAFDFVRNGGVKPGDKVRFMADPLFEVQVSSETVPGYKRPWRDAIHMPLVPIVWMVNEQGQIIGQLNRSKTPESNAFLASFGEKYRQHLASGSEEKFYFGETTVNNVTGGIFAVSNDVRNLNDIPNLTTDSKTKEEKQIHLGVVTGKFGNYQMSANGLPTVPIEMNKENTGRTYVLVKQANGLYLPMACKVSHFNKEEFNPFEHEADAQTELGKKITNAVEQFISYASSHYMSNDKAYLDQKDALNKLLVLESLDETGKDNVSIFPYATHEGMGVKIIYTPRDKNGKAISEEKSMVVLFSQIKNAIVDENGNRIVGTLQEIKQNYGEEVMMRFVSEMEANKLSQEEMTKAFTEALSVVNPSIQVPSDCSPEYAKILADAGVVQSSLLDGNNYNSYVSVDPVNAEGKKVDRSTLPIPSRKPYDFPDISLNRSSTTGSITTDTYTVKNGGTKTKYIVTTNDNDTNTCKIQWLDSQDKKHDFVVTTVEDAILAAKLQIHSKRINPIDGTTIYRISRNGREVYFDISTGKEVPNPNKPNNNNNNPNNNNNNNNNSNIRPTESSQENSQNNSQEESTEELNNEPTEGLNETEETQNEETQENSNEDLTTESQNESQEETTENSSEESNESAQNEEGIESQEETQNESTEEESQEEIIEVEAEIVPEESNEEDIFSGSSRIDDSLLEDIDDDAVVFRVSTGETIPTWNKKKELAWLKRVLPQLSEEGRIRFTDGLIRLAKEKKPGAWGSYKNGIITLSDIAAEGTLYHEAFHAVMDLLLSSEQKDVIFEEAKTKYGNKNRKELEEILAEEFRRYVMSQESPNPNTNRKGNSLIHKIGKAIANFFKSLFAKIKYKDEAGYAIPSLFKAINEGKFANKAIPNPNISRTVNRLSPSIHNLQISLRSSAEQEKKILFNEQSADLIKDLESKGFTQELFDSLPEEYKEQLINCRL